MSIAHQRACKEKTKPELPSFRTQKNLQKIESLSLKNRFKNLLLSKKYEIHKIKSDAVKKQTYKIPDAKNHSDECEEKKAAQFIDQKQHIVDQLASCLPITDRLIETNGTVLANAKIATQTDDNINRLIRKLTLSFTAKKSESQFAIASGVFRGAKFHVITQEKNVRVSVSHASLAAKNLLMLHKDLLKTRLAKREINLSDLWF